MRTILTLLTFFACALHVSAGDIYVSVNGNDDGDGSMEKPLATLRQALQQAREWRRTGCKETVGGINIILGSGTYTLDETIYVRPEDSGTADSPTVIEGAAGADVRICGGGAECKDVYKFDPNKLQRIIDFNIKDRTITIPTLYETRSGIDASSSWVMLVHQRWAIALLRVKSFNVKGDSTVVTFLEPESRIEFAHPWPQPVIGGERGNSSFCLKRITSADNRSLERLVTVCGTEQRPVSHITFRNITFEYTAWRRPATMGHVTLQGGFPIIDAYKLKKEGLPWSKTLENQAWTERPQSAVSVSWADDVNFMGCTFTHLSSTALDYVTGTKHCTISGNQFSDIGGTAILAGSFMEGATEVHRPLVQTDAEFCENITISRNNIYDAANEDWGCVGIGAGLVRNVSIVQNEVSYVNYSGICVGWGWTPTDQGMRNNIIDSNYVHDYARQLYDAGGIYTLSNQPNSYIRNNRISAPADAPFATNERAFCIYFDEATDGYTVEGNDMPEDKIGWNKPGKNMNLPRPLQRRGVPGGMREAK